MLGGGAFSFGSAPPKHPAGHEKGAAAGRGSGERSRHPVLGRGAALTLAWRSVVGAGFALPRDAGRRPAFQAVPALLRGRRCAISLRFAQRCRCEAPTGRTGRRSLAARHPGCGRPDATAFWQQLAGGRRSLARGAIRANDGQFTAASSEPGRMRRALGRLQTVARRAPLRRVRNPQRNVGRTHERPPAREQLRGVQARGLKHPGAAGSAGRQLRREFWKSKSHWNRSSSS